MISVSQNFLARRGLGHRILARNAGAQCLDIARAGLARLLCKDDRIRQRPDRIPAILVSSVRSKKADRDKPAAARTMPLRRSKREDGAKRRATVALPRIALPLESQPEKSPFPSQVCSTLNSGHCHVARHRRAVHVLPDAGPVRSRIGLAEQSVAANRARVGPAKTTGALSQHARTPKGNSGILQLSIIQRGPYP
jgi:hypothetical protein